MNAAVKYWIAAVAYVFWLVLAWLIGSWLHLQGGSLWILRIGLWLIGAAPFAAVIWYFRLKDQASVAELAGAEGDEIGILIREADARLQASQLGRDTSIGTLPVFMLLGETGSAKTSVVLNCGMEPELLSGHTVQDNVIIPTRAANLWYMRQFVFAEAGGSLLADPAGWARLVRGLASRQIHSVFGKGTPSPRAALVCIDCESFLQPGAAEALAGSMECLRTCLREVSQLLGIALPVYVLLTRSDRLPFFQDYVRNLSTDEAGAVLGATLPMVSYTTGVYAEQETARVAAAFDELFYSLAEKRRLLLGREFDAEKLSFLFEFPRELRKLRPLLVRFLVDICRPSQLRIGPFLRGFYFSGVRPVVMNTPRPALDRRDALGQPSDARIDLGATGAFNLRDVARSAPQPLAVEASESRRIPQWVFLPHLFSDVLLKDSSALAASASSTKTSFWRRVLLATSIAVLVIVIIGFLVSFVRNKNLESEVQAAAQGASDISLTGQQLPSLDALTRLETLRQAVETLAQYQEDGPPLSMRWGLYEGNALYPYVRRIYFRHFNDLLFASAQGALVRTLTAVPASPGPTDPYGSVYNTLRAYLITTSNHEKSTVSFLSPILLAAWAGGRDIDQDRVQLAQKQFEFYSEQLITENPFSTDNNAQLVSSTRNYLAQFSGIERAYRYVLAEADKAGPALNFNRKFPGSAEVLVDGTEVTGAFTKPGWLFMQKAFQDLSKYFSGEEWVLGSGSSSNFDIAKLSADLRTRYLQDYIAQWRTFLKSATVTPYSSLDDAAKKLLKLSSNQSPLLGVVCMAAENTAVDQPDIVKAFQSVQSVVASNCQKQYVGPQNSAYMTGLSGLQACLDRANSSPSDQKDAAKQQCLTDSSTAQQAARQIGQGFQIDEDAHIDQTVQDLLVAPITTLAGVLRPEPVSGAGICAQMAPLASKFPFSPRATSDASVQDVAAFFVPGTGALSQFYEASLKNLLLPSGQSYIANPAAPQKVMPAFLSFFNRALAIQKALYPGGGTQMQFRYALRPHPTDSVKSFTMTIDGQNLDFKGGNGSFKQFAWPGNSEGVRLSLKITGGSKLGFPNYDGPWGVFHFFADADKSHQAGSMLSLEWVLRVAGGRPVTAPNGKPVTVQFDLDTQGAAPILRKGFFSDFRCVSTVAR